MTFILADGDRAAKNRWSRIAHVLVRTLSLMVILITGSRTGFAIVVAYFLGIRLPRSGMPRQLKATIACGLLVGALFFILAPGPLDVLGRGNPEQSTEQHVETRASAAGIGLEHPLTGVGLGNLGPLLGEPPDRSSAHALPFTVFAEEGTVGLLLGLLALAFPFAIMLWNLGSKEALGLTLGVFVALWLYDFVFVLDVAVVWWAFALASVGEPNPQRTSQRLSKLWMASRNVVDRVKASPTYRAEATAIQSVPVQGRGSRMLARRAAGNTTASASAGDPARTARKAIPPPTASEDGREQKAGRREYRKCVSYRDDLRSSAPDETDDHYLYCHTRGRNRNYATPPL